MTQELATPERRAQLRRALSRRALSRRALSRRALDVGYTAGDLQSLFQRRSRTPVPQTLTYMIDDAARRHGGLHGQHSGAWGQPDQPGID